MNRGQRAWYRPVSLLRGDDHVRVEWQKGEGYAGKRIMRSARALLKLPKLPAA